MINKRLLIKNLLAYSNENTFFDKKRILDLETVMGKSKFLKHISALSNANPFCNSYLIVGVEDADNALVGVDFFDDSKIQNLVNAYLNNPPNILYENILFPQLDVDKVIGLVTIYANSKSVSFKKNIGNIFAKTIYCRVGSISMPVKDLRDYSATNPEIVRSIENSSKNSIKDTLDGVVNFIAQKHPNIESEYLVFKEIFVLCWAGVKKQVKDQAYYSRVDIELINEQVRLFYSALDEISVVYTSDLFEITEYVSFKIKDKRDFFPFEKVCIHFNNEGSYQITRKLVFERPIYDAYLLQEMFTNCNALISKIKQDIDLSENENSKLKNVGSTLALCHLYGYEEALQILQDFQEYLKQNEKITLLASIKGALRVLRKLKYEVG